jgi:hypothetical protein
LFEHKAAQVRQWNQVDKGHGRIEQRTIEAALGLAGHRPVDQFLDWPHVRQAFRMTRRITRAGQTRTEVAFAITDLPAAQLSLPAAAALWRGHWAIENRLHWVRDVTFDEDRSQVRSKAAPQAMAACRNATIALIRRAGYPNIAAALRRHAAHPKQAIELLMNTH